MQRFEYKVVPAPKKGVKAKGVKTPEGRFSHALQELMNTLAAEGWDYQRAETLPSVERAGLTSSTTEWRNVLVFRRPLAPPVAEVTPELLPSPEMAAAAPVAAAALGGVTRDDPPVSPSEEVNATTAQQADEAATDAPVEGQEAPEPQPQDTAEEASVDKPAEETKTTP